jgi:integrase
VALRRAPYVRPMRTSTSAATGSGAWSGARPARRPALRTCRGFMIFATHMRHGLARGTDLQVVKERLGHGSIMTTQRYLR